MKIPKHTLKDKQVSKLKPYSKPQLTVLGKANELTLGHEVGGPCDGGFPGKGDLSCS